MISALGITAFVSILALAVWTDVRSRRIPNALTAGGLLLALVLRGAMGLDPFLTGLLGMGLALVVLLPLFATGGVGGGDAKLLIAAGAFLGPMGFLVALVLTAIVGGAMSLLAAARAGALLPMLYSTGGLAKYWASGGRSGERVSLATPGALSVPYGVAIGLGCVATLLLRGGF